MLTSLQGQTDRGNVLSEVVRDVCVRPVVRKSIVLAIATILGLVETVAIAADAQTVQEVVVLGSRIKRIEAEGPSPVITISDEELQRRGYATVSDALKDLSQASGGSINQQQTFGFVPSASAIDLRGFGVGRSLVLLDGRRLPTFPIAANGTDNFVDISSIPAGAIERIDVLTDGASAIYGSDAVSGVVNIVLKKNTEDQVTARYSDTTDGGGASQRYQIATGIEDENGGSLLLFMEYFKQNKLMFTDRDYSRSDRLGGVDGTGPGIFSSFGYPGTFVTDNDDVPSADCVASGGGPGVQGGFCRFNRAIYRQLIPEFTQKSVTAILNRPLTDSIDVYGRAIYFTSRTEIQIEPMGFDQFNDTGLITAADALSNPTNPLVDTTGRYAGLNGDGVFRRRLIEFGPRTENDESNSLNVATGLRGQIGKFDWDVGVQYAEQRLTTRNSGFARKDAFGALIHGLDTNGDGVGEGGTLNLFEPIPQAIVDQVSIQPRADGRSTFSSADLQLSGDLFEIWGDRSVGFAGVVEYAKQSFRDERDPDTLAGNVIALGGTSGGGDRKYSAVGIEFEVPVLEQLVVNLAGRYDHYDDDSDVGGAFSPRIAIEYRPLPAVLLRGSAGRSFRAPDMQRLFGATTSAFLDLVDTPKCIQDGGTGRGDPAVASCTQAAQGIDVATGANRELEEERGENYSIGVVWEVLRQLTVSLDVFRINLKDVVNTPDEQLILDKNAADGSFADAISRNALLISPQNPGGLALVSSQARNLSFQKMTGIDFETRYTISSGFGDWSFDVGATYLDKLTIQEVEGEPAVNVLADGILGEFVRFKGFASVGWRRDAFAATVFVNHTGAFTPINTASIDRVGSWTTTNISGSWDSPWNGTIQLGVNNVFDRDPPLDLQDGDAGQPFYNQSFHNALGANWFVNYSQRF